MSDIDENLNARQRRFIAALLNGATVEGAAEKASTSTRQAWRWMANSQVRAVLRDEQDRVLAVAASRLLGMAGQALDALEDVLQEPGQPGANIKRLTAQTILSELLHFREYAELEARVTELEQLIGGKHGKSD